MLLTWISKQSQLITVTLFYTRVFFQKWLKAMLPYKVGGGLPVVGIGDSMVTHTATAGSVISQSIAFKYVMTSEP